MARFEAFWDVACDYVDHIFTGLAFFIFLFVLAVISLLLAPRGTGSFAISLVSLAMITVVGSVVAWMYWTCSRRLSKEY